MKKKTKPLDYAIVLRYRQQLSSENEKMYNAVMLEYWQQEGFTLSMFKSLSGAVFDILNANKPNTVDELRKLVKEYRGYIETNQKVNMLALRGKVDEWKKKLSAGQKNLTQQQQYEKSPLRVEYWVKRGWSPTEALQKVNEKRETNRERASKSLKEWYSVPGNKEKRLSETPTNTKYWEKRFPNLDSSERERLRQEHLSGFLLTRTLDDFIDKYGVDTGTKKYYNKSVKQRETMLRRYGHTVTGCPVSKESISVLGALLEKLQERYTFDLDDIVCGCKDTKEFVRTFDGNTFFYDFVDKKRKVCVEYNNVYWHPKTLSEGEWHNSYYGREEKYYKDQYKMKCIEDLGFRCFIIWSDEDIDSQIKSIVKGVEDLYV